MLLNVILFSLGTSVLTYALSLPNQVVDDRRFLGEFKMSSGREQDYVAVANHMCTLHQYQQTQNTSSTKSSRPASFFASHYSQHGNFNLRKRDNLSRRIRVRMHYHCPISGDQYEDFQWSTIWEPVSQTMHYFPETNIDKFPQESITYNDDVYPATFGGSWFRESYRGMDRVVERHCCKHTYSGYFQGWLSWQGIVLTFIDYDPLGRRSPVIREQCVSKNITGISKWTVHLHCDFVHADVTFPTQRRSGGPRSLP